MKFVVVVASSCLLAVGFSACDGHSWEDTKVLFGHGGHSKGEHGDEGHGEADAGHGDAVHEAKGHEDKKDH